MHKGFGTSLCFFFIALMFLLGIGLTMVYSTTEAIWGMELLVKQAIWIGIGIVLGTVAFFMPLLPMMRLSRLLLICVGVLLCYLFVAVLVNKIWGEDAVKMMPLLASGETKGSFRWLGYRSLRFQPSEFAKFALLLFLSVYYGVRSQKVCRTFRQGVLYPLALAGPVLLLIALGKDLSTTVVTGVMVMAIMFCSGVRSRWLLVLMLLAGIGVMGMIMSSPERQSRIISFRQAKAMRDDEGYQLYQSMLAMGSGGMEGRGFTRSLLKEGYLPEKHTDFILAIWGEEFGVFGSLLVMLCYFTLVACVFYWAIKSRERVEMLVCVGFGVLVAMQSGTNIGVISGCLPTTGVTAPFVSYGGSSMMSLFLCLGLVLNVCRRIAHRLKTVQDCGQKMPSYLEIKRSVEKVCGS